MPNGIMCTLLMGFQLKNIIQFLYIFVCPPPPLSFYPSLFYIMYIFVLFPSSLPALPFSSFSFHLLHHATQSRLLFSTPALSPLQWRHKEHDGVSSYQRLDCLINHLFRRKSKETSKLRVTGLCEVVHRGPVNSPHKGPVTRKMFPFHDVTMHFFYSCKFYAFW